MNNWLTKKKEQFNKDFTEPGSYKVYGFPEQVWDFIEATLREFGEESRLDRATDGYFQDFERGYNQSLSDMEVRFKELLGEE